MIAPASPYSNGHGDASTVRSIRRVVRRNRWLLVGAPILAVLAAAVFIAMAVPVYDGMTTLRIDKQRSNLAVLDALQELSTGSEIHTEMLELRSRSLAEEVVDVLDLNAELREPKRVPRSALFASLVVSRTAPAANYQIARTSERSFRVTGGGQSVQAAIGDHVRLPGLEFVLAPAAAQHESLQLRVRPFALAVKSFSRTLNVGRPDREADMLEIRYESKDPDLVRTVPNEVARQFILRRDSVRKTQARSTVLFLAEQIDTLRRQLRVAETGLLAFREREHVVSPQVEGETQVRSLADFQAERDALEAQRMSLAGMLSEIERAPAPREGAEYRRLLGFPELFKQAAAGELLRSLNELEGKRSDLLRDRTPADPDVVTVTQLIRERDNDLQKLMTTYLQGLTNSVASLDEVLNQFKTQLARIPAKEIQLARLRREAEGTEDIFKILQTRLHEAQIAAAVEDPSVRVVDPATWPLKPIRPNKPLSLILALMLGVALAGGLAFAREHLDNTIRSREELQEASGAIPVLGLVPRMGGALDRRPRRGVFAFTRNGKVIADRNGLTAGLEARGPVAEAYRTLRTNIAFTQQDTPAKILVITSAVPGEGKSTNASNLAIALAQQGLRILLIDADMRRGTLHRAFGANSQPGLSNVLAGQTVASAAIQPVTVEGAALGFMGTGATPPNPAELLASTRVPALLEELRQIFDVVVIDAPPLNVVTDAAILGSRADGVVLIARAAVTERDAYRHALEQLQGARARVLGSVLNDVDQHASGYYGRAKEYYLSSEGSV